MNKKDLRDIYLQKRRGLLPEVIEAYSKAIVEQFKDLSLQNVKLVHIFYPIPGKQEFNSLLLKEHLRTNYPEMKFVLPKSNIETNTLTNILWDDNTPLAMNEWGITEPEHGVEVPSNASDMVIVPLLVFDKEGNRIGYGKGFYDRFLSECRSDLLKAGVSYFGTEANFDELDEFDVPLDICVTPDKVWRFAKS